MPRHPLEILKSGLAKLKKQAKACKDALQARLQRREKISADEEDWLDNAGNHVDEDAIINLLENTSDYERGLSRLNPQQKGLVDKLKGLGEGVSEAVKDKKQKR